MSRRRGEFEHRTSIFEGAFRAWSHLGGLDPTDLESKLATDLDPLNFPIENDPRLVKERGGRGGGGSSKSNKGGVTDGDGGGGDNDAVDGQGDGGGGGDNTTSNGDNKNNTTKGGSTSTTRLLDYPYEPLPRSGLAHPFVQAILSPWLGPDADQDAIQLGLTTLRTWWQHRRKGESGSAVVALGTDKMQGVVEGYTRHFFNLSHCLIVNDKEQPPRTLHGKMRDLEKSRNKKGKKRSREDETIKAAAMAFQSGFGPVGLSAQQQQGNGDSMMQQQQMGGGTMNNGGGGMNDPNIISPLERLHAAQRRQLAESGGVHTNGMGGGGGTMNNNMGLGGGISDPASANSQPIEMKGRCVPGKVDLPGLVQQVSSAATQLAHRGMSSASSALPTKVSSMANIDPSKYGDPNITPIIVVSPNQHTNQNDIQFYMTIDGITCAHCVKIVETVLKGCTGSRSPIGGLLDAAADMELNVVLIKIENVNDCRRIAHEAARNLSMVGYTAKAKCVNVPGDMSLGEVYGVMERTIPAVNPMGEGVGFQWGYQCGCPDNNVLRQDCARHSRMGNGIIEMFDKTEDLLNQFVNGCTKRTAMPCTAGVHCFCQFGNGSGVAAGSSGAHYAEQQVQVQQQQGMQQSQSNDSLFQQDNSNASSQQQQGSNNNNGYMSYQQPIQGSSPSGGGSGEGDNNANNGNAGMPQRRGGGRSSMRMSAIGRMSIGGMGGLGRQFSLTSETTFGRAMSGLSALSIDWENMDDFDVNVDHSAGINNDIINGQQAAQQAKQGQGNQGSSPNSAEGQQGQDNGTGGYGQQPPNNHQGGPRVARRSSLRKNIPFNPNGNMAAYNVSFNM